MQERIQDTQVGYGSYPGEREAQWRSARPALSQRKLLPAEGLAPRRYLAALIEHRPAAVIGCALGAGMMLGYFSKRG